MEKYKSIEKILKCQDIDIGKFDSTFLFKTIEKRIAIRVCDTLLEYCNLLERNIKEVTILKNSLYNSYSEFFRNPLTFACLEQIILPDIIRKKKKSKEKEIRIWSAASAGGHEPYSIAIIFNELKEALDVDIDCRIFATDINKEELSFAKKGHYSLDSLNNISFRRGQENFSKQGDNYVINSKIKNYIDFSHFDLFSENDVCPEASIFGNFDLVFCSNLLFYFKPKYQSQILKKASHCAAPGSYLVSGETEREILINNRFREVFVNSAIFQKI